VTAVAMIAGAAADDAGFVPIFNGTSLEGWEGKPEFWSVQDGAIVGQTTAEKPTKGNTFLIWRQGNLDDFELELKYRITGGNSGIQYRSKDLGDSVVGGYQGDFEAGTTYSGILYEEKGRGILAKRGERVAIATDGTEFFLRFARLVSRAGFMSMICLRSLAMRVLIRRRSSSILVSPGPREPMPTPPAAWPPA
jgi:hypothetical protein